MEGLAFKSGSRRPAIDRAWSAAQQMRRGSPMGRGGFPMAGVVVLNSGPGAAVATARAAVEPCLDGSGAVCG